MDLLKLFTNQHNIAGLEISDTALRLVNLEVAKTGQPKLKTVYQENINPGVVVGGNIVNQQEFLFSLQKLVQSSDTKFAVVTIPSNFVFSKVYEIPEGIKDSRLETSMKLITDYQLPNKPEEIYFDWEKINNPLKNEVLLALIKKEPVKKLLAVLDQAGLKTVALEFHPLSIARLLNDQEAWLVVEIDISTSTLYVFKNQAVRIYRSFPAELKINLAIEIEKIINYYEFDNPPIKKLAIIGDQTKLQLGKLGLKPEIIHLPELFGEQNKLENNNIWLAATGAAIRGLISRKKDNLISLMEIGPKENYSRQKAIVFTDFLSKTTIAISFFFVLVFVGAWLFILSIQKNFNQQIEYYNASADANASLVLATNAKNFNSLIETTSRLVAEEPNWDLVVKEIIARTTPGILINNLSIPSLQQPISLIGVALTRADLNLFKKSLENSNLFKMVNLPLDNLGKKDNIPFSISFSLSNPESLYIK